MTETLQTRRRPMLDPRAAKRRRESYGDPRSDPILAPCGLLRAHAELLGWHSRKWGRVQVRASGWHVRTTEWWDGEIRAFATVRPVMACCDGGGGGGGAISMSYGDAPHGSHDAAPHMRECGMEEVTAVCVQTQTRTYGEGARLSPEHYALLGALSSLMSLTLNSFGFDRSARSGDAPVVPGALALWRARCPGAAASHPPVPHPLRCRCAPSPQRDGGGLPCAPERWADAVDAAWDRVRETLAALSNAALYGQ